MKSAEQWLEELGINTGEKVCVEIEDVRRIQIDAINSVVSEINKESKNVGEPC